MALDVIGGFDGLCRTGRHDQTSMFIARRCIARLSCHHPRRHVWPQVFGLDLGIWLRISDAPMTWTCEVRIGKEPANTVEAIGIVAVKARPLDRAYHFAVFKSHAASIPAVVSSSVVMVGSP